MFWCSWWGVEALFFRMHNDTSCASIFNELRTRRDCVGLGDLSLQSGPGFMVDGVAPLIIPYPETATSDQITEDPENSFSISIVPLHPPLSTPPIPELPSANTKLAIPLCHTLTPHPLPYANVWLSDLHHTSRYR